MALFFFLGGRSSRWEIDFPVSRTCHRIENQPRFPVRAKLDASHDVVERFLGFDYVVGQEDVFAGSVVLEGHHQVLPDVVLQLFGSNIEMTTITVAPIVPVDFVTCLLMFFPNKKSWAMRADQFSRE